MGTHSLKVLWVPVHSGIPSEIVGWCWEPGDLCWSTALGTGWWGLIDPSGATSFLSCLPLPEKWYFPSSDLTNCKPLKMALPKQRDLLSELLVFLIWEGRDGCCKSFFISAAPCSLERGLWDARSRELPDTFLQGEQRVEQCVSEGLSLQSPNQSFVFKSCLFLIGCN